MKETLYSSASIVLFGRRVDDLSVTAGNSSTAPDGQFARIYGFSVDGMYFEIPSPVLMLVKGDGVDLDTVPVPGPNPRNTRFYADLKAWIVHRTDDTVRLDVEQGKFEEVLLDIGVDGPGSGVSGAKVSGAKVSGAKVSGAKVSGAKVSGAKISGARISGARD